VVSLDIRILFIEKTGAPLIGAHSVKCKICLLHGAEYYNLFFVRLSMRENAVIVTLDIVGKAVV
jgi:hypothetical protein